MQDTFQERFNEYIDVIKNDEQNKSQDKRHESD